MYRKNQLVSIYGNDRNEIIVIPTKCNGGPHIEALPFEIIKNTEIEIGTAVKKMFALIEKDEIELPEKNTKVFQLATGIKAYSSFVKKHLCVNVIHFEDNGEYMISNSPRLKKGCYGVVDEATKAFAVPYMLSEIAVEEELGIAVKKAFSDGRKYIQVI